MKAVASYVGIEERGLVLDDRNTQPSEILRNVFVATIFPDVVDGLDLPIHDLLGAGVAREECGHHSHVFVETGIHGTVADAVKFAMRTAAHPLTLLKLAVNHTGTTFFSRVNISFGGTIVAARKLEEVLPDNVKDDHADAVEETLGKQRIGDCVHGHVVQPIGVQVVFAQFVREHLSTDSWVNLGKPMQGLEGGISPVGII